MERNSQYDYKPLEIKYLDRDGNLDKRELIDGCNYESVKEMALKKSNGRRVEIWTRNTPYHNKKEECIWYPTWEN